MVEYPPILRGDSREQLAALRDYLVRLARSLEEGPLTVPAGTASGTGSSRASASGNASSAPASGPTENEARLRALIVKTANTVREEVERLGLELHGEYLALSDFGSYRESMQAQVEATARQVVESYDYESELEALDQRFGGVDSALTTLRGEIRRGVITDPETGETAFGIAIAESLSLTGQTVTENGLVYWELSPGQTLGVYTASGWQFWINGSKRGWFDSRDSQLHVSELAAERGLRLGADWIISAAGGFGLRYMGG